MDHLLRSEGLRLAGHLALPSAPARAGGTMPGVILAHGFPSGAGGARTSAATYPELADRIAGEVGWAALTFNFRGCGGSQGNFSLRGWLADLGAAVDHLSSVEGIDGIWLAGASTGGSLCIARASSDPNIRGVAALAARADFDDWAGHPRRFCDHARDIGVIRDTSFPSAFDAWARELREIRPLELVRHLPPRPLLVIHGSEDDYVPVNDARVLADAHGECDLRVVTGAGHRLRHDPRAVAILLGWLDRQKARITT